MIDCGCSCILPHTIESLKLHTLLPSWAGWPPCRLPNTTPPISNYASLILTRPRSPIRVRGSMFQSHRTISVQLVSDLYFVCNVDSRSTLFFKTDCGVQKWNHEYSPNKRILVNSFHLIAWRTIQCNSQPLIHFWFEWDWTGRTNRILLSSPKPLPASPLITGSTRRPVQAVGSSIWLGFCVMGDPVVALELVSSWLPRSRSLRFSGWLL